MIKEKSKSIMSGIFLTIILFFMCSIIVRTFTRQILIKRLGMTNMFIDFVLFDVKNLNETNIDDEIRNNIEGNCREKIDWKTRYPFTILQKQIDRTKDQIFEHSKLIIYVNKYKKMIKSINEKIDTYTTKFLIGYDRLVELSKIFEKIVKWNYMSYSEYNGVIKLDDGYLTSYTKKKDVTEAAESTAHFSQFCKKRNINFLYVQTPTKICKYEDKNITGVLDFSNQNLDNFLKNLKMFNIDFLDLRKEIHDEKLDHHKLFYRTDHHWKGEIGLWASRHILCKLINDYKYNIDLSLLNENKFNKVIYPEWFLGSQGKKVTLEQTKPDDFSLLYPIFETCLHYEIPNKNINNDGNFSILYDMDQVVKKDYYGKKTYSTYIYADQPLEKIENRLIKNNGKILIIHDSFGNCVIPFLSLCIKFIDSLDLRYFNGSVQKYIDIEKPDTVIIIYNIYISESIDWSTNKDLFDFR